MEEELAGLERLRESSQELVSYLEKVCEEFTSIQNENEKALGIMENWAAVFRTAKGIAKIQHNKEEEPNAFRKESLIS